MVTLICIILIILGLFLMAWGDNEYLFLIFLLGFFALGYGFIGLMSHHLSSGRNFDRDFTIPKIVKAAEHEDCYELVLRKGEYPKCISKARNEKDFTDKYWSDTAPGMRRWKKQYTGMLYREVTASDLDTACLRVVKSYSCQKSSTVVVIGMEKED